MTYNVLPQFFEQYTEYVFNCLIYITSLYDVTLKVKLLNEIPKRDVEFMYRVRFYPNGKF